MSLSTCVSHKEADFILLEYSNELSQNERGMSPLSPEVTMAPSGILKKASAFAWATWLLKCCGFKLPVTLLRKLLSSSHPVFVYSQSKRK